MLLCSEYQSSSLTSNPMPIGIKLKNNLTDVCIITQEGVNQGIGPNLTMVVP